MSKFYREVSVVTRTLIEYDWERPISTIPFDRVDSPYTLHVTGSRDVTIPDDIAKADIISCSLLNGNLSYYYYNSKGTRLSNSTVVSKVHASLNGKTLSVWVDEDVILDENSYDVSGPGRLFIDCDISGYYFKK